MTKIITILVSFVFISCTPDFSKMKKPVIIKSINPQGLVILQADGAIKDFSCDIYNFAKVLAADNRLKAGDTLVKSDNVIVDAKTEQDNRAKCAFIVFTITSIFFLVTAISFFAQIGIRKYKELKQLLQENIRSRSNINTLTDSVQNVIGQFETRLARNSERIDKLVANYNNETKPEKRDEKRKFNLIQEE